MNTRTRRDFLKDVGASVVAASVGSGLAGDLGFSTAFAQQGTERLTFGQLEALVSLMQETAAARLLPVVVERLRDGTPLRDIVAAAALANARTFGGEDYVGFHTLMAISPSYHMAQELPEARRALPVLKVLHRNATRIQEQGGTTREVLRPVQAAELPSGRVAGEVLRETVRGTDRANAERLYAAMAGTPEDALNNVLYEVQDGLDVHRVVMPYRAWDLMGIIGRDQAHTLLRQSVRYCVRQEGNANTPRSNADMRAALPRLLDQHRLIGRELGNRAGDDRWVEEMSNTIFRGTPQQAADAAATALAEGMAPDAIGEAISLAANQLVLRDNGRPAAWASANKPIGSIHGDSVGVHGCDTANAWRNLSRVSNARNKVVCLLLGAWQVARDRGNIAGMIDQQPYPREDARLEVSSIANNQLLGALESAIRNRSQIRAAAITHRYLGANQPIRPLWDLMLRYAISEDGALHHEKFYRTTVEEYAAVRAAFKPRYLIALARVTASGYGYAAGGYTDACRLLGV